MFVHVLAAAMGLVVAGCVVDAPNYVVRDGAPDGQADASVGPDAAPATEWSTAVSSDEYDFARAVAYDPSGNVYLAGSFHGTAILAGESVTSNGQDDVFVAKFSPEGTKIWVRLFGGTGPDDVYDIKADGARVVLVGSFTNSVDFGTGLITAESTEGFVVGLDPEGSTVWIDHRGGAGSTVFRRVALDSTHLVTFADFTSSVTLPSGTVTAHGTVDLLAISYSLAGAIRWSRVIGGTNFDNLAGVTLTDDGDALVVGHFRETLDVGLGTSLVSAGGADLFVAKLAAGDGTPMWARRFGSSSQEFMGGVDHSDAAIWIVGHFTGATSLGGTNLTSEGMEDAFVAVLDQFGALQWAKSYGAEGTDKATRIAALTNSAVVVGSFNDTILVEGANLESQGDADVWVAELTNSGAGVSARRGGGSSTDAPEGLAIRDTWLSISGNTRGAFDMFGIQLPPLDLFSDGFAVQLRR